MTFTEGYATILLPFVEEFKKAKNENARKAVVRNAADAVSKSGDLSEDGGDDLPKDLKTAITHYIKAFIKKESSNDDDNSKPSKLKQTYKIRDVIKQIYQERIEQEIPYNSSDRRYLGCYQRAVTAVYKNLTNDELKEVEGVLDSWNKQGAPTEKQLKRAKTRLPGEIKKKLEEWKFTSGALVMCLVAYSDGKEVQGFHVESPHNVGNPFTNTCNEWKDGTYENFKDWAVKQFGLDELDADDDAEVPVLMQKAKNIEFERDEGGQLILPPMSEFKTIREKQRVIRGYIGAVYRDFTGNPKAAFPYMFASEPRQQIYCPHSVPEGFSLSDPDHLKTFQIDILYRHLLRRQSKGLTCFKILKSIPHHGVARKLSEKAMGKKKIEYVETNSDDGEVKSSGDEQPDEDEDEEEEVAPLVKIGPPGRNGRKSPPNAPIEETPPPVAGSSKDPLPQTKTRSKTLTDETRPVVIPVEDKKEKKKKKASSKVPEKSDKKRKAEEVEDSPSKKTRAETREYNEGGSKKRKGEDQEESPSKRRRLDRTKSNPPKKPRGKSPVQQQARGRESTRVKEFPAGNITTSSSRISFLQSLCNIPEFLSLVDLVPALPKASTIPKDFPSWASWKSREVFLPANFHTITAFNKALSIAKKALAESTALEGGNIDAPLLLLGLMYREVSRAVEIEPGAPTDSPDHLIQSKFGIQQLNKILSLIKSVVVPC